MSTTPPTTPGAVPGAGTPPLRRARDERVLVGVCAGVARTLGVPVIAVRVVALVLALALPPLALVAYAGLALAMPRDDGRLLLGGRPPDSRETIVGWGLIVASLIAIAAGLETSMFAGPGGVVLLAAGVVLLVVGHQRGAAAPPAAPAPVAPPRAPRSSDLPYPGAPARPGATASFDTATAPLPHGPAPAVASAPPAPRERSVAIYGVAALVAGVVGWVLVESFGWIDTSGRGAAVAFGVAALAFTAAAVAWARRPGAVSLVAIAVLLAFGAIGAAAVGDHLDHGIGERTERVLTPADAALEQRLGIGELTVEVAPTALAGKVTTLRTRLGIGELHVAVPAGVRVVSTGPTDPDGIELVNEQAGPAATRTLRLDAGVDHGDAEVHVAP